MFQMTPQLTDGSRVFNWGEKTSATWENEALPDNNLWDYPHFFNLFGHFL